MRFSPSTLGWYPEFINYPTLPNDLVVVSDLRYRALLGKRIEAGSDGQPREYVPPPPDPRLALKAAATAKRWEVETGGVTLPNGVRVGTGTADQDRITTVIANAALAGVTSVDFKAQSGWVTLTIPEVQAVAAAVALHVQACFSAERAHHEAIDALPEGALAGYDVNAGWPG